MIADTAGQYIDMIRENEIGIYDTSRVVAVYCCEMPDGRHKIRTKDGTEFTTKNNTIVQEHKK